MKFCTKCGKEVHDDAVICPGCGCYVNGPSQKSNVEVTEIDEVNIGFCILAALIPLFGIIYWPVNAKKKPKCAQAVGVTAIVAWVVYILLLAVI